MSTRFWMIIGAVFAVVVLGWLASSHRPGDEAVPTEVPEVPQAPNIPQEATSTTLHAALGERVAGLGVALMPLEVVQDSRCPSDVQCVWAGVVQVRAKVESGMGVSETVFEIGQPFTTEGEVITLTEVAPYPRAGKTIASSSYQFSFEILKRTHE